MHLRLLIANIILLTSCQLSVNEKSYLEKWKDFETQLIRKEKSFQPFQEFDSLGNEYAEIVYPSDELQLKGLLNFTNIDSNRQKAILVYLHGGFALRKEELKHTQPFTNNDMIVFAPSWRGENGNPGSFELFMGEVQDAKAAIRWISSQPFADPKNVYVFGWSIGGGIALNLSLHEDLPIKLQGSSAGIYDQELINSWATEDDYIKFPYDYTDSLENYFRLPIYHLEDMKRKHIVYLGEGDDSELYRSILDSVTENNKHLLRYSIIKGDHVSSLQTAIELFLIEIKGQ